MGRRKIDKLRDKFRDYISAELFHNIWNGDPSPTKKYAEFMLSTIKNRDLKGLRIPVDVHELVKCICEFDKNLHNISVTDIYNPMCKDYQLLLGHVEHAKVETMTKKMKKIMMSGKEKQIDILLDTETFLLLHPKSHEASMKYGGNTTWCTTDRAHPHRFYDYQKGWLVYIISRKRRTENYMKLALHVSNLSGINCHYDIYNQLDKTITGNDLMIGGWEKEEIWAIDEAYRRFVREVEFDHKPNHLWGLQNHHNTRIRPTGLPMGSQVPIEWGHQPYYHRNTDPIGAQVGSLPSPIDEHRPPEAPIWVAQQRGRHMNDDFGKKYMGGFDPVTDPDKYSHEDFGKDYEGQFVPVTVDYPDLINPCREIGLNMSPEPQGRSTDIHQMMETLSNERRRQRTLQMESSKEHMMRRWVELMGEQKIKLDQKIWKLE